MTIKKFWRYIGEQNETVDQSSSYDDVKQDLSEMVEKSLKSSDKKTKEDFISAYLRDSEKNQIEGLINDSDIYEFYLKYRNNIDEILSKENFFEQKPSDLDSFSLYDYLIVGTKKAIKSFLELVGK